MNSLQIIPAKYFDKYHKEQPITLVKHFNKIKKNAFNYGYAVSQSAVSSSQIEGNILDLDTYLKFDTTGANINTKSFLEIKYLENAYKYAKNHSLNLKSLLHIHYLLTYPNTFEKKYRGKYRDVNVYVGRGQTVLYNAPVPELVSEEMQKLFTDILFLIADKLSISQVFYYATFIHLIFAKIHPFIDGNGRAARLLEKWFLAEKLGEKAWFINPEKLYLKRRKSYYNRMEELGRNYQDLDYDYCLAFLKMLPMSLRIK